MKILTERERQGEVWQKIQEALTERLAAARKKNDQALSEGQTAMLRGRIAELKWLLSEGEESTEVVPITGTETDW